MAGRLVQLPAPVTFILSQLGLSIPYPPVLTREGYGLEWLPEPLYCYGRKQQSLEH